VSFENISLVTVSAFEEFILFQHPAGRLECYNEVNGLLSFDTLLQVTYFVKICNGNDDCCPLVWTFHSFRQFCGSGLLLMLI
jgi:hypothetical protein